MNSTSSDKAKGEMPSIPLFAGNIVDSAAVGMKRIRRKTERVKHGADVSHTHPNTSHGGPTSGALSGCNPWTRLCEKLLPWRILSAIGSASSDGDIECSKLQKLPILYETIDDYILKWEEAIVDEIKANIASKVTADSGDASTAMDVSEISDSAADRHISKLLLRTSARMNSDKSMHPKDFCVLDLVLVSREPISLSQFLSTARRSEKSSIKDRVAVVPPYCLCLVTASDRSQGATVYAGGAAWRELKALSVSKSTVRVESNQTMPYFATSLDNITSCWREYLGIFDLHRSRLSKFLLWGGDPVVAHFERSAPSSTDGSAKVQSTLNSPQLFNNFEFYGCRIVSTGNVSLGDGEVRCGITGPLMHWMSDKFNESQRLAIRAASMSVDRVMAFRDSTAVSCDGSLGGAKRWEAHGGPDFRDEAPVTLIQGPPGTGKTSTIVGLLNIIHVKEYAVYFERSVSLILGEEGILCRAQHLKQALTSSSIICGERDLGPAPLSFGSRSIDVTASPWVALVSSLSKFKPRILVTAPSNVAVDNILCRIVEDGFRDGNAKKYFPNILRIGAGSVISQVFSVTLEGTMEKLVQLDDSALRHLLEVTKNEMIQEIKELFHFQTLLLNLKVAYNDAIIKSRSSENGELSVFIPVGWELRVSFETAQPYWVDHIAKVTQSNPPQFSSSVSEGKSADSAIDSVDPSQVQYTSLGSLPEYLFYATRLVAIAEHLEIHNIQSRRISLYINRRAFGGCGGYSMSTSGGVSKEVGGGARQVIESSIIDEAHIVFTTLNGSGHPSLESAAPFPILVVDEAAQCTEPSVLIPFRRGCEHCVLVGDPQQLPATVFSQKAALRNYDRSLFERLTLLGNEPYLLNVQYRMHPSISQFPNSEFYRGLLSDGENVHEEHYLPPFLRDCRDGQPNKVFLKPLLFFNLTTSSEQASSSKSLSNPEEVQFCLNLVKLIATQAKNEASQALISERVSIGVITPYAEQVKEFNRVFRNHGLMSTKKLKDMTSGTRDSSVAKRPRLDTSVGVTSPTDIYESYFDLEVNTVDGFQGREKDVILISCVRASAVGGIGFLSDARRMNVALTRAKKGLFIVGNSTTLQKNKLWAKLIQQMRTNDSLIDIDSADEDIPKVLRLHKHSTENCKLDSSLHNTNSLAVSGVSLFPTCENLGTLSPHEVRLGAVTTSVLVSKGLESSQLIDEKSPSPTDSKWDIY